LTDVIACAAPLAAGAHPVFHDMKNLLKGGLSPVR
jgi:hypothetical protein